MLKGLAFDLDGVITDSTRYHLAAWRTLAKELGINLPDKVSGELCGLARMDSLELVPRYGYQKNRYSLAQKEVLAAKKSATYQQAIKQMTQADTLSRIFKLLEQTHIQGLRTAITSASTNTPTILKQLGLLEQFGAIADPKTLTHDKPNPGIYQKVRVLLGPKANEAISFEDVVSGIAATKTANQFTAGIGGHQTLKQTDLVIINISELDLIKIVVTFNSRKVG